MKHTGLRHGMLRQGYKKAQTHKMRLRLRLNYYRQ